MKTSISFEASERLIRLRQVIEMTGRSRTAIYDDISQGKFPRPVKIGPRASAWKLSSIRSWMEALPQGCATRSK
jgi:prophage regulatory protein